MILTKLKVQKLKILIVAILLIVLAIILYRNFISKADEVVGGMTINGIVTNLDEEPIEDALIMFMQGDTVASQAFSDVSGKYQITLPKGGYNMQVITDDGLTGIESPLQVTKDDYNTTLEYNIGTIPDDNFEISPDVEQPLAN